VRLFFAALLALPSLGYSQVLASAVLDSNGPSETVARKAQKAIETSLKSLSGAAVRDAAPYKKGAPKKCTDNCAKELARGLGTPGVVLLDLKGSDTRVVFDVSFWLDGERLGSRRGETAADALEPSLKAALEQLLPGWLRKGFGALSVQVDDGAVVKVDGRVVPARPGDLVPVPAGVHQVDVLFPNGSGVMQRLEVTEGRRVPLEHTSTSQRVQRPSGGPTALRYASYGLFMTGSGSVAAGLLAGALARSSGIGLTSCDSPDARSCSTLAQAQAAHLQAQQYAGTGNLLLGVGASLIALGVSLFVVDVFLQ
jgi:hypothetical protein